MATKRQLSVPRVRQKRRIKKGDRVVVITGKYKGKVGDVLQVMRNDRVIVMGINVVKKHKRGNPQTGEAGGIVDKEAPIHISNVALYNAAIQKADRVGYKFLEDGTKVRYFKSTQEVVDI